MADDDSVTLNCQQCDAVITFSEVSKVTEDYGRQCERKFAGKPRDAGSLSPSCECCWGCERVQHHDK